MTKTGTKRLLSLLLMVAMLISCMAPVFAEDAQDGSALVDPDEYAGLTKDTASYADGVYEGTGTGFKNGEIKVKVTVTDGKIAAVELVSQEKQSYWDEKNVASLFDKIVEANSPEVDGVTGATKSSDGVKAAVRDALSKAEVQPSPEPTPTPDPEPSQEVIFASGVGTKTDPYIINNAEQLTAFAKSVNSGESYKGKYVSLNANIALSGSWTPIGASEYGFGGHFNGNNYVISGMTIGSAEEPAELEYAGLFGNLLSGGTIRNVGVSDASIINKTSADPAIGMIVAFAASSTVIENCWASGTIASQSSSPYYSYVGGLVGDLGLKGLICNSYSTVNVLARGNDGFVGGIVGQTGNKSAIINCAAFGKVENYCSSGNMAGTGGIVGMCAGAAYACYSDCTIHMDASSDMGDGSDVGIGGIAGYSPNYTAAYNCWFNADKTQSYYDGEVYEPMAIGSYYYTQGDPQNCEGLSSKQLTDGTLAGYLNGALTADGLEKGQKALEEMDVISGLSLEAFYGMTENGWNAWEMSGGSLLPVGAGVIPAEPEYFESGDGSIDSPYVIVGEENFIKFAQAVTRGSLATSNRWFKLGGDIALTKEWTPIANFAGTFDGDGHTVSGLAIGTAENPSTAVSAGLFGAVDNGTVIRNINLTGAAIYVERSGSSLKDYLYVGALVGGGESGGNSVVIDNCTVSGSIVSAKSGMRVYTGGLVGYLGKEVRVNNSIADIAVKAVSGTNSANAGGLVGALGSQGSIINCAALGDVTAEGAALQYVQTKAGGLISSVPGLIENCYASGNVTMTYTGSYTGYAGLIAGEQSGSAVVDTHYFSGAVLTVNGEKADAASIGKLPSSWYSGVEYNKITAQDSVGDKAFAKAMNDGASEEGLAAAAEYLINSGKFSGYTEAGLAAMRPDTWNYWVVSGGKVVFGEPEAPVFESGTGTAEDPFIIKTEAQLRAFAATTYGDEAESYSGKFVALDADIVLSGDWTPINRFAGTFDGRGHCVSNVAIGSKDAPANIQSAGFFGVVASDAVIKNLDLKNVNIYNSYNDNSWRADNYAGALVGGATGSGENVKIDNCSVSGVVSANAVNGQAMAGGLIGYAYRNWSVTNCVADTSVSAVSSSALANGGGLVGAGAYVLYENCGALGDVYVQGNNFVATLSCKAGGFAGTTSGILHNCYASGNVTLVNAINSNTPTAGGLLGDISSGYVYGCYYNSKSSVTADGSAVTAGIGSVNANNAAAEKVEAADTSASGFAATMNEGLKKAELAQADAWLVENTGRTQDSIDAMRPGVWYAWKYVDGATVLGDNEYVEPKEPDYSFFESGKGTEEDPWVIMNLDQLNAFAASFDETGYSGKFITLGADIDISGMAWKPIGQTSENGKVRVFSGTFDGAGHKITGMTIGSSETPVTDTALYYAYGFFAMIANGAVVKDLGIENSSIYVVGEQTVYAGMIAGFIRASTVDGCWATGTLSVRTNEGDFENNCFGGGIAAYSEGCEILNSWTDVEINAWCKTANAEAGGIAGMSAFGLIANCYSLGDLTGETDRTVDDGGVAYLGGIAGCQAGTIYNCYSTSDLTANSWSQHVGAIAGMATAISETYYSYYSDAVKISIGGELVDPVVAIGKEVPSGYSEETGAWMSGSFIVGLESVPAAEIGTKALADKLNANFDRCPFEASEITTDLRVWVVSDDVVTLGSEAANLTYVEHPRPQEPKNYEYIDGTYYGRDNDENVIVKIVVKDHKVVSAVIDSSASGFDADSDKVFNELLETQTIVTGTGDANEKVLRDAVDTALNKALIGDTSGYGPADPSKIFASGTGTAEDPFIIKTEAQLRAFAEAVNTDEHFIAEYIALDADIVLHGAWMPIGSAGAHFFAGIFDGRGHTISNMRIGSESEPLNYAAAGLFTDLEAAVVKNLRIDNASIYNKRDDNYNVYAGLIAGMVDEPKGGCGTTINNVAVSGTVVNISNGWSYTGGVAGYLSDSILINSSADVELTAVSAYYTALCGGMTGICSFAVVANNYAVGSAYAEAGVNACSVGGIAGMSASCTGNNYADVAVSSKNHTGDLGGIAGRNTAMGEILYGYYNKDKAEKGIGTNVTMAGVTGYYSEVVGMTADELHSQALADLLNDNQCEDKDLRTALNEWISGYELTTRETRLTIDSWVLDNGLVHQKNAPAKYVAPEVPEFTDIDKDSYYYDAVIWAASNGIAKGTSDTTFEPEATCTRAQALTFIWRAAGSPMPKNGTNPFTDVAEGEFYYDAVLWAYENGIAKGTSDTTFEPDANIERAQFVTFLYRYAGAPSVSGSSSFTDVPANEYFYDAVLWAVENGVTNGTSETTFSPSDNATRAQVVCFIYRWFAK